VYFVPYRVWSPKAWYFIQSDRSNSKKHIQTSVTTRSEQSDPIKEQALSPSYTLMVRVLICRVWSVLMYFVPYSVWSSGPSYTILLSLHIECSHMPCVVCYCVFCAILCVVFQSIVYYDDIESSWGWTRTPFSGFQMPYACCSFNFVCYLFDCTKLQRYATTCALHCHCYETVSHHLTFVVLTSTIRASTYGSSTNTFNNNINKRLQRILFCKSVLLSAQL